MRLPDEKVLHALLLQHPHLIDPAFLGVQCDTRVRLGPRKIADLVLHSKPVSIVELKVVPYAPRWGNQLQSYLELFLHDRKEKADGVLIVAPDGQKDHESFIEEMAKRKFSVRVLFWDRDVPVVGQLRLCNNCNRAIRHRVELVSCRYCRKSVGFRELKI
ncbi:MAG: hypothetical protein JNM27_15505 [Leptospirales bacterium]|nr:hypothetical protein [Leptospirales bacterium]